MSLSQIPSKMPSKNAEMRLKRAKMSKEMSSITASFHEFMAYKATAGTAFLAKLEKSHSRRNMRVFASRRGKLQLERGEIPRHNFSS